MQQRLISVLAGAVVLFSPLVIGAVLPKQSLAQSLPGLEKVQLTEQQKTKLVEARTQMRTEIDRIVTNEQRSRYKAALDKGGGVQQRSQ
ncbi:MAG: hypothetical protein HC866_09785 [Leptolyngbyaceae cyanobacterium RU_5_1]|nr:hypothetical protein [Leptolyngbyaceae cyanobacterium RU_5_1]